MDFSHVVERFTKSKVKVSQILLLSLEGFRFDEQGLFVVDVGFQSTGTLKGTRKVQVLCRASQADRVAVGKQADSESAVRVWIIHG